MTESPVHDTGLLTLEHPSAISAARGQVATLIDGLPWIGPTRAIDVVLLVSELLTNAFRHATPGSVQMRVRVFATSLRVDVRDDHQSDLPHTAVPPPEATEGRGLWLLRELSDHYGVDNDRAGKGVWFAVHAGGTSPVRS